MASSLLLRLRRALPLLKPLSSSSLHLPNPNTPHLLTQSSSFRSSTNLLHRFDEGRKINFDEGQQTKIDPSEILFEGCDYNHWLITMDFPKDPEPTAEEKVETYVQTLAKVVGSVEEAKKRMYACSTTTYQGFQAEVTEEMSEKFRGLPGVVFILPDSYIDPVNKQYGGDKYDNGVITPRPPPIQYGRQGRYGDRNRNYDRPTYDRPPRGQTPMQQGDGRSYAPQQTYNQSVQDGRGFGPPGGRDFAPGPRGDFNQRGQQFSGRDIPGNFDQGRGGNFPPQEQRNFSQGQGGNFPPQGPASFSQGQGGNFPPQGPASFSQGQGSNFPPRGPASFSQGQGGNFPPQEQRDISQGQGRDYRPGGSAASGNFGQESSFDAGPVEGQPEPWQAKY